MRAELHGSTSAATVLSMAYGYSINTDQEDPLVRVIDKMMTEFSLAAAPMAWMVDIVPFLRHLPEGFPGATFQKTARTWRRSIQDSAHIPYDFVKQQMETLTNKESYVSRLIKRYTSVDTGGLSPEDESAIVWTAASLYGAAADTSVITLTAFALAMLQFPEVQRKAQEEIDRVVGADQLPSFEHRDDLPYINALVKECLRWWPIAPLGFPHTADEDIDIDEPGLPKVHIPKGAFLLPAAWWFLHDPQVYENPDSFEPESSSLQGTNATQQQKHSGMVGGYVRGGSLPMRVCTSTSCSPWLSSTSRRLWMRPAARSVLTMLK